MPKEVIVICGHRYAIDMDKPSDQIEASGRTIPERGKIQIASDPGRGQALSTMLHEIIEAINYHFQLGLPHSKIMILEAGLYDTLTRNGVCLDPLLK